MRTTYKNNCKNSKKAATEGVCEISRIRDEILMTVKVFQNHQTECQLLGKDCLAQGWLP
jgi:hypothetical protein